MTTLAALLIGVVAGALVTWIAAYARTRATPRAVEQPAPPEPGSPEHAQPAVDLEPAADETERVELEVVREALAPLVGEILDSCDGATGSAESARGVAQSIDRSVARLGSSVDGSVAALGGIRDEASRSTQEAADALARVRDEVRGGDADIESLRTAVAQVASFVDVIRGVADQTNLLALNASIEAARAGDAGRGFAVVAGEVRRLAESSAHEAAEVREAIERVGRATDLSVQRIGLVAARIEELAGQLRGLDERSASSWERAISEVGAIRERAGEVDVANRQALASADRSVSDISAIQAVATRLGALDVRDAERHDDALEVARRTGTLRVGVWHGFRGLNFPHPGSGQIVGLEVDLLAALGRDLGLEVEMVDAPWVDLPKRLKRREFDLLFCALIPSPDYRGIAYTRSYLDMGLVTMRRAGDARITADPRTLDGLTVAIIADPAARQALADCGIRPGDLREVYDDDYYDPVADGIYDAFVIDLPIVHWCASDPASPWHGRIETVGDPITRWIYSAATRAEPESQALLEVVDAAIGRLRASGEYRRTVERWQGRAFDWRLGPDDFLR